MDLAQQKEKFSDAYLQAVVAVAGYGLAKPDPDDDSIDWIIAARGAAGTPRRPRLEVQLKCSARDILRKTLLHFPLAMKNYDDLRDTECYTPRILVVITVPDSPDDWLAQTEEELAMRHCGYWVSLRGKPEKENTTAVTIRLPRSQLFTPDTLRRMMQRINDERAL